MLTFFCVKKGIEISKRYILYMSSLITHCPNYCTIDKSVLNMFQYCGSVTCLLLN